MMKSRKPSWALLKARYVERRLAGEAVSLSQYADEIGVDRRTVERHSANEAWLGSVAERAQERLDEAMDHVAKLYHLNLWRSKFRIR